MPDFAACQLLIDPPADGAWNMAVDEVLLAATAHSGLPTLRFYQWQRPTLSLGYFQKSADRTKHPPSINADVVRRLSGGGAIVHDQELTYSLFLPVSHELSHDPQALVKRVHQTIAETLNACLASTTSFWQAALCNQPSRLAASEEPFLCFERRSIGDILLRKKESDSRTPARKIVGSAQRRRKGVVLQHGSILLGQSKIAPELLGIEETTQTKLYPADLLLCLPDKLAKNLFLDLSKTSLPESFAAQARKIQETKYQAANWSKRR